MTVREMIIIGLWVFYAVKKLINFYANDIVYDFEAPDWLYYSIGTIITILLPFPLCAILYLIFC